MVTILNRQQSTHSPICYYTVQYDENNITKNDNNKFIIPILITVEMGSSSTLSGAQSLTAQIDGNGIYGIRTIRLKAVGEGWGTSTIHRINTNLYAEMDDDTDFTIENIRFRVTGYQGNTDATLSTTNCNNILIPHDHIKPRGVSYTITETNPILTSINVPNNVFVANLSIKNFNVVYNLYDNANLVRIDVSNTSPNIDSHTAEPFLPLTLDFTQLDLHITQNESYDGVPINFMIVDDLGGYTMFSYNYNQQIGAYDYYDYIPYTKINIIAANTTAKRKGQISGLVSLNLEGTFYNGEVGDIDQTNYKPILKYKIWKVGETEPANYDHYIKEFSLTEDTTFQLGKSYYTYDSTTGIYTIANFIVIGDPIPADTYYEATDVSIINNGTFTVDDFIIGSTDETSPNYIDPKYAYRIKILAEDNFTRSESNELSIAVGEATWTEYKDRVDFKAITIKKQTVLMPYELYQHPSSASYTDITLSDDLANYEYIEVYYYYSSNHGCKSEKVYQPNGKTLMLNGVYDNGEHCYICTNTYALSGTTMTRGNEIRWRITTGGGNNTRTANTTNLQIYRVVGYK